MQISEAI